MYDLHLIDSELKYVYLNKEKFMKYPNFFQFRCFFYIVKDFSSRMFR